MSATLSSALIVAHDVLRSEVSECKIEEFSGASIRSAARNGSAVILHGYAVHWYRRNKKVTSNHVCISCKFRACISLRQRTLFSHTEVTPGIDRNREICRYANICSICPPFARRYQNLNPPQRPISRSLNWHPYLLPSDHSSPSAGRLNCSLPTFT